jgi:hypothetical protein
VAHSFIHISCSILTTIYFPKLLTGLKECQGYKRKIPEQPRTSIRVPPEHKCEENNDRISAKLSGKDLLPWLCARLSNYNCFSIRRDCNKSKAIFYLYFRTLTFSVLASFILVF